MYEKEITALASPFRISELFRQLQDISGEAAASWNAANDELAKIGLMWIVVRYELNMLRTLSDGEVLRLCTWASPVRHKLSQRHYIAYDAQNDCVMRGAGVWAIADRKTRSMIDPIAHHIPFYSEETGDETPRPRTPEKLACHHTSFYTVTRDVLDENDHMNNTRYFDVIQKCAGLDAPLQEYRQIRVAYMDEARLGERMEIQWGEHDRTWYFSGKKGENPCFQIGIQLK